MRDKLATSKRLNAISALGFTVLAIGAWTGSGSWFWRIVISAIAIFQILETRKLYRK